MSRKYLITEYNGQENHAGSKARNDIDSILLGKGFTDIRMTRFFNSIGLFNKIKILIQMTIEWLSLIFKIEHNATIVVQYPLESPKLIVFYYMKLIKAIKKVNFVAIIHDLESLRFDLETSNSEIKFLEVYNNVIAHNEKMKKYLIERGMNANKVTTLTIFDYLTDKDVCSPKIFTTDVNIAGNLDKRKSKYVYKLSQLDSKLQFNLFGPNFTGQSMTNVIYKGQFPADELPQIFSNGFGLIWDGDSIETCTGITGKYLTYNNPHKLSLYMVSELPVIIWEKAAMAEFVIKENVGITIDNLNNLSYVLEKMTEEDYNFMVENTQRIAKKLKNGQYTIDVIEKLGI